MMIGPRYTVRLLLLIAVIITIGCDRMTKDAASKALSGGAVHSFLGDTVRLQYAENAGGFLGMGEDLPEVWRTALFTFATGVMLVAMALAAVHFRWRGLMLAGVCLLLAGGASNWIDRFSRGTVVDFLNVGIGPLRTGIFNVADVAITLGAAVLFLARVRGEASESGTRENGDES